MQKHKKISECPYQLQRIIDGVNNLPANADEIQKKLKKEADATMNLSFEQLTDPKRQTALLKRIQKLELHPAVLDYLIGDFEDVIGIGYVLFNFMNLRQAKSILSDDKNFDSFKEYLEHYFSGKFIQVGDEYEYQPDFSGLLEILMKGKISPKRIKCCPICGFFFWTKRSDQKTCGKKQCSDTLSQRNYQSAKKELIKERRRINYRNKKNGVVK